MIVVQRITSSEARRGEAKPSNNISKRDSERSELSREAGILSDLLLSERSEVSGKSAIYYVIHDDWSQEFLLWQWF